jgi:hypothetical protein
VPATSQTVTYNQVAALALDKLSDKIADAISTGNKALHFYRKKGNWKGIDFGGNQLRIPVMYQLQTLQPLGAYGTVNVNAIDADTAAYYAWVQTAVPISFSDLEEFRTGGAESIESIVDAKKRQSEASLDDFFSKSLLRGQAQIDTTSLATPVTSSIDGSVFIDPLPLLVKFDPTSSTTIGGINQSTNSWWQNQLFDSAASTLTAFLGELRRLHVLCQRGGGGKDAAPDFHIVDERTYNVYERALSMMHQNPNYQKSDIPFENVAFKGKPVVFDELVPDVKQGSTTVTDGTWYMLNSAYLGFTYDKRKSFKVGESVRPNNQLVETALMPVRGAHWTSNRRKQGVMGDIDLTTLEAASS